MIEVRKYTTMRLKLLEACQLSCHFCHHEGNSTSNIIDYTEVVEMLPKIKKQLNLDKVHLTGGEPTLYKYLDKLIGHLSKDGFRVAMTSHGLFSKDVFEKLSNFIKQGDIEYLNFSIHTLDVSQYMKVHGMQMSNLNYEIAQRSIETISEHAVALSEIGTVNVNCVPSESMDSLSGVFDFTRKNGIELRLVPDWTKLYASMNTISNFLLDRKAQFSKFVVVHPTSNYSAVYSIDGCEVSVKLIRPIGIESMCKGCEEATRCVEFFGNLRLEGRPLQIRLCIHRQGKPYVQPLYDFLASPQIRDLQRQLDSSPDLSDLLLFQQDRTMPNIIEISNRLKPASLIQISK